MQKIKVIEQNKKRVKVTLNPTTINTLMKGFPGIYDCTAHTHHTCTHSRTLQRFFLFRKPAFFTFAIMQIFQPMNMVLSHLFHWLGGIPLPIM